MTAIGSFEPAQVWLRRGSLDRSLARGAGTNASGAPAADLAGDDEVSPHGVALYLG